MKKGEKTRNAIIKSAIALFYKSGFPRTTLQQVASRAGVTQPCIYSYFQNKEALLAACCLDSAERGRIEIDKATDPFAGASLRLKHYLLENLKYGSQNPADDNVLITLFCFASSNPQLLKAFKDFNASSTQRLAILLSQGNREGAWTVDNPLVLGRQIHNFLVTEMIKMFHTPEEMPIKQRLEAFWETILKILK